MSFLDDAWDTVKSGAENVLDDLNPVTKAKEFMDNPLKGGLDILATYGGGPFSPIFLGKEALNFMKGDAESAKSWDDLNPFQKLSLNMESKLTHLINTPLKWIGLDVDNNAETLINKLKHTRGDDAIGNMLTGQSTGPGEGSEGQGFGGMGASPSEGSLGRPLALEQDPVLNQPTDNFNNFSF